MKARNKDAPTVGTDRGVLKDTSKNDVKPIVVSEDDKRKRPDIKPHPVELIDGLVALVQEQSLDHPDGFYEQHSTGSHALVQYSGWMTAEEIVCVIDLDEQLAHLPSKRGARHDAIERALIKDGYTTVITDEEMACPVCRGLGFQWFEDGYVVTGSGFGDCAPREQIAVCALCHGAKIIN